MSAGVAASVHARLLNHARASGDEFNLVLTRYAVERFLYRLSISPVRDEYCLKGAQLFLIWFSDFHRPTRDADFMGHGPADSEVLMKRLRAIAKIRVDDGIIFDSKNIHIEEIRREASYGGFRARVPGQLGRARCPVMLDFGFGDAIVPGPEPALFPTLLPDLPIPNLWIYPRATVVAEKLEAMIDLGMGNSRMKDYFDLLMLFREGAIELALLADAIAATFARRGKRLPDSVPIGLSDEFGQDASKQAQWGGFLKKHGLDHLALMDVVEELRGHVMPAFRLALGESSE